MTGQDQRGSGAICTNGGSGNPLTALAWADATHPQCQCSYVPSEYLPSSPNPSTAVGLHNRTSRTERPSSTYAPFDGTNLVG